MSFFHAGRSPYGTSFTASLPPPAGTALHPEASARKPVLFLPLTSPLARYVTPPTLAPSLPASSCFRSSPSSYFFTSPTLSTIPSGLSNVCKQLHSAPLTPTHSPSLIPFSVSPFSSGFSPLHAQHSPPAHHPDHHHPLLHLLPPLAAPSGLVQNALLHFPFPPDPGLFTITNASLSLDFLVSSSSVPHLPPPQHLCR